MPADARWHNDSLIGLRALTGRPSHTMIATHDITGLVLAGGRGRRMGDADKGLVPWRGQPLAAHVLARLSPQVGAVMISANRHLDTYAALGAAVLADDLPGHAGPLAGVATALTRCTTPWLAVVPCDTPNLPTDLVARLADGLTTQHSDLAVAVTSDDDGLRRQSVFLLLPRRLLSDLNAYLDAGEARVSGWLQRHHCADVCFDNATAFQGANTLSELERLP